MAGMLMGVALVVLATAGSWCGRRMHHCMEPVLFAAYCTVLGAFKDTFSGQELML